jgi:hypothetical protein
MHPTECLRQTHPKTGKEAATVNEPNETERRRFNRILFDASVTVMYGGLLIEANLIDISLKGALVRLPESADQEFTGDTWLKIQLDEKDSCIEMEGEVVHREPGRIGFQCRHIDMDSITHLRRLVELNLGDPSLLERELEALG